MSSRFPTVGVIGAGQLARMMVAPATALGIDLLLFAASPQDSGAQINKHVVGDYTDLSALKTFAEKCDVVTFEHELVPASVIKGLEQSGVRVFPSSKTFLYSQDKAAMREKLSPFPSPEWSVVTRQMKFHHFRLSQRPSLVDMTVVEYGKSLHNLS